MLSNRTKGYLLGRSLLIIKTCAHIFMIKLATFNNRIPRCCSHSFSEPQQSFSIHFASKLFIKRYIQFIHQGGLKNYNLKILSPCKPIPFNFSNASRRQALAVMRSHHPHNIALCPKFRNFQSSSLNVWV